MDDAIHVPSHLTEFEFLIKSDSDFIFQCNILYRYHKFVKVIIYTTFVHLEQKPVTHDRFSASVNSHTYTCICTKTCAKPTGIPIPIVTGSLHDLDALA